ncbi:type II secretion system F family protein [Paraburkholderia pallida]|nr:type II secretion system F family protein [Paraburkholderia pallida]
MNADLWRNGALLFLLAAFTLWLVRRDSSPRARIVQRTRQAVGRVGVDNNATADAAKRMPQRFAKRIAALGERLPVVQADDRAKLAMRLANAGFRDQRAVAVIAGLKIVAGACLALGAIALGGHLPKVGQIFAVRALLMAGAFVVGMMLPEYALAFFIRHRRKAIAAALPDALDLLVVCTNAGNSLVVAIKRVASELRIICPQLADEFTVTADELSIGGDTAQALHGMSARVGLPTMRALVTTLVQSQKYGTPVTQSLRTLSRTERTMQMVALEEKAAKLAPKMVMPMMFFIMPTVSLIAAGPAAIRIMAVFNGH